ncbi:MAG: MATE family efflux transporter [Vicinamibacterales bacterium]|nr:MATE family efflux transporter [Vicinamibacterales bacterium]
MREQTVAAPPGASVAAVPAWRIVVDALRGVEHDYTAGSVRRAVVLLAIPMVMEMAMESIFAVVDVFWVSRLGADAVATVGLTEAMLAIVYTVALALGIGATAVVARRIGERDEAGAAEAAAQALLLGLIVAASIGVVGAWQTERLLGLMGATPSMIESSSGYARIMFGGNLTVTLLFLINAIYRGAGNAAIAMRMLWLANAINLVLDPLLIFGVGPLPELGVTGAAVATNIGRGTAVVVQLAVLMSGSARIRVRWVHLRLMPAVMWTVCRLSATGFLQILIDTSSWIGLVRVVASFGSEAMAGYTIGIRMVMFAILPAWGLSNAAATMVGQALGAGKPDRAEEAVWTAGRLTMYLLGGIGVVFIVFAPQIAGVFTPDPVIVGHAVTCLRIVSSGFLFFAYGLVLTQAFNGAGDPWTPTWLNFGCFWLWQIPLAWLLALELGWGPSGVYWAITIAFSTFAVVSAIVFRRGGWKQKQV